MGLYDSFEAPINQLARVVASNRERDFTRRIEISLEVKDISVRRESIRVHPDYIEGIDLLKLVEKIFELEDEFTHLAAKRYREKEILETRERVKRDMEYLLRSDPSSLQFLQTFIHTHTLPRPKRCVPSISTSPQLRRISFSSRETLGVERFDSRASLPLDQSL